MISSLRLQQFRCFESLQLEIPAQGALFIGNNAQGKTSILEAVCMLVRLQSPRVKRSKPMIRVDQAGFGIAGECWQIERQVRYGRGGLVMKSDGEEVDRQAEYFQDGGLVVWMGNEDLELVRGVSEVRRRYLDFLGCQADSQYRRALTRYRRALKARNVLLKDARVREAEIEAYDDILVNCGDYLIQQRECMVNQLEPLVSRAQSWLGNGKEEVKMIYKSGCPEGVRRALELHHEKDRLRGQTISGPHRDDIRCCLNGLAVADYASEGQQRTLALALKLAQGEALSILAGKIPVYLLDDIFGELDPLRRNAVMEYLPKDAQVLITTTNVDWLDEKWADWHRFRVDNGQVF